MAATVTQIEIPNTYTPSDEVLLNPSITQSSFNPSTDYIEYTISTPDNSFSITNYSYNNYSFPLTEITSDSIPNIVINPESDLVNDGYNSGEFNVYYNFLKNELNSSYNNQSFFIKDISSDRTEVIISNNIDPDIVNNVNPQCNHFGSMGIVQKLITLPNEMGTLVKYMVTNHGGTYTPGMMLTKTMDQLAPVGPSVPDDMDYTYDDEDYDSGDYDDWDIVSGDDYDDYDDDDYDDEDED